MNLTPKALRRIDSTLASFEYHVAEPRDGGGIVMVRERIAGTDYIREWVVPRHTVRAFISARRQIVRHQMASRNGRLILGN